MASILRNNHKHLVVQMSAKEAIEQSFETKGSERDFLICAICGQVIDADDVYYVPALNDILCKELLVSDKKLS